MVTTARTMSDAAIEKLDEARCRLTCLMGRFWRMVLTENERQRLGGSKAMALGVVGMWQKLHGCSEPRAVIEAITALEMLSQLERKWLLKEIGESMDDVEDAIHAAVQTGDLVLVERPRRVYWKKRPVDVDWAKQDSLWDYMYELASHSKRNMGIESAVFGEKVDKNYIVKKKHTLTKPDSFPASLAAKIVNPVRGTQTLDIPPERIHIFEIVTTESVQLRLG